MPLLYAAKVKVTFRVLKKFPGVEPESSLLQCPQDPASGIYPEPDESTPHPLSVDSSGIWKAPCSNLSCFFVVSPWPTREVSRQYLKTGHYHFI
jgi:hypothetical protein